MGVKMTKKIGILRGREDNFPNALVEAINHKGNGEVVAEMATMGAGRLGEPPAYDLIYDRISHDYPWVLITVFQPQVLVRRSQEGGHLDVGAGCECR